VEYGAAKSLEIAPDQAWELLLWAWYILLTGSAFIAASIEKEKSKTSTFSAQRDAQAMKSARQSRGKSI
jgi:hypothetical protein